MNASHRIMRRIALITVLASLGAASLSATPARAADWSQWGGANQDFKVKCGKLANEWPDEGPPRLWQRDLGEGYSGIVAVGGTLYTMYRDGDQEVVIALDAKNGKTKWEYKYDAPIKEGHVEQFGKGPRATPMVNENRLYTIGVAGKMHCLNCKTGKVLWKTDLWDDFKGTFLNHGYSSSPFPYKDNVIVMVGGKGNSLVAFNQKTGKVAWKKLNFDNSYSTPKLIKVGGEDQLLCFMAKELIGIDPNNGKLKWRFEHGNRWGQNITLPVWANDDLLFFSSVEAGSRTVKLDKKKRMFKTEEVWHDPKIQIYHSQAFRIGDYVYGCSSQRGPGIFTAMNVKTGEVAWKERGFSKATCLFADGKFIILDEDGELGIAEATPEKFKILSKTPVMDKVSWTIPTLVGTKLYIRDKKQITAFELGREEITAATKGKSAKAS